MKSIKSVKSTDSFVTKWQAIKLKVFAEDPKGFWPLTLRGRRGFTLVEVLVTITISTMLFIAISSLMSSFLKVNSSVKNDIKVNDEKEITYLTLKNYLEEGGKIIYQGKTTTDCPDCQTIVLLNKADSKLLPFTIITTQEVKDKTGVIKTYTNGEPVYNLVIKNVAYVYDTSSNAWKFSDTIEPRSITHTDGKKYTLDYEKNQVYIGTPTDENTYCKTDVTDNCILVGYKQNELVYGPDSIFAYAPFVKITKPTDLKTDGTYLWVLSPYDNMQYKITLGNYKITTTAKTVGVNYVFPSVYDLVGNIQDITAAFPSSFDPSTIPGGISSSFGILNLQLSKNVYMLQGTGTITTDSINGTEQMIEGTSTIFSTELHEGDTIRANGEESRVKFIYKNESLKITPPFLTNFSSEHFTFNPSNNILYKLEYKIIDPMYTSDGTSTTNPITDTDRQSSGFVLKTFSK